MVGKIARTSICPKYGTLLVPWRSKQAGGSNNDGLGDLCPAQAGFFDSNELQRRPHPPYSRDLTLWEVYLFEYCTYQTRPESTILSRWGQTFEGVDAVFHKIHGKDVSQLVRENGRSVV
jgi:hypothetical protein